MPEIPRLPDKDPPATAGAQHDRPSVDHKSVSLTQAFGGAAVAAPIAGLRRPLRAHLWRRSVLPTVGGTRAPRFAAAAFTDPLVHGSAQSGGEIPLAEDGVVIEGDDL